MNTDIFSFFEKRHSFYNINDKLTLSIEQLKLLISRALELYPSAYNSQSARLILLLNDAHNRFWDITEKRLFDLTSNERHKQITNKIASFRAGAGTILFYDDHTVIQELNNKFPLYAENFNIWSLQANAILQFMIWTALANNNIGASLQHYNPIIDDDIARNFNIDNNWNLVAQMPFGGIVETPRAHEFNNQSDNLIIQGN